MVQRAKNTRKRESERERKSACISGRNEISVWPIGVLVTFVTVETYNAIVFQSVFIWETDFDEGKPEIHSFSLFFCVCVRLWLEMFMKNKRNPTTATHSLYLHTSCSNIFLLFFLAIL